MSLFQKKQEIKFGGFIRLMQQKLLQSKGYDIKSIDKNSVLSDEEIQIANEEVFTLRLVLLTLILSDISKFGSKTYSSEDVSSMSCLALFLALQDTGTPEIQAKEKAERYIEKFMGYIEFLLSVDRKELEEKGQYFFVLRHYQDIIFGNKPNVSDEQSREKLFIVFDAARQVYRNDEKAIKALVKQFKFLNE